MNLTSDMLPVRVMDFLTFTYKTATITEISWTIVAMIGLVVSFLSIIDAQKNLYYLHADQRPISVYDYTVREILAKSHLHNELFRIGMHGVSVMIGIVAMDTMPANPNTPLTALGYVLAGGLITTAVLNVSASVKDRRVRSRMLTLLIQEERERATQIGAMHS